MQQRLERELKRDYHIITADKRLDQVARDFVKHYSTAWETGKAMIVCIDKVTCVWMYNLIGKYWKEKKKRTQGAGQQGIRRFRSAVGNTTAIELDDRNRDGRRRQ